MSRMKKMEKELRDSWERWRREVWGKVSAKGKVEIAKGVARKYGGMVIVSQDIGRDSVGLERVEVWGTGLAGGFTLSWLEIPGDLPVPKRDPSPGK